MIFNMVGGGGGSGATLVVSSPANVSVTVSKDDKSYTKNSGSLGSATFKGLATGTWTVTISGNGQTATKTIEITADYAITIAFFSASINITYPATSTCVVTNSGGQTVASDTNTGSSTKTWTATVGATGTYTVTATATDGSGKSKSTTVSITADGQIESVTLSYSFVILRDGEYVDTNFVMLLESLDDGTSINPPGRQFRKIYTLYGALAMRTAGKIPAGVKTIKIVGRMVNGTLNPNYYNQFFVSESDKWPDAYQDNNLASLSPFTALSNTNAEYSFDISGINKDVYLWYAGACGIDGNDVVIVIDDLEGVYYENLY